MRIWMVLGFILALTACGKNTNTKGDADLTASKDTTTEIAAEIPLAWLEEVEGERALAWVEAQNTRSIAALKQDPRFRKNYNNALAVLTADERIPYGSIRLGMVYNFWQDDTNPKGLWRRTSVEDYANASPTWEIVLDVDALSKTEDKNWVFKGVECYSDGTAEQAGNDAQTQTDGQPSTPPAPSFYRCMMRLSDGGKDAVVLREFDMLSLGFVADGFTTAESKQGAEWLDQDTLLIATDWGGDGGTMTESGYPSEVRVWTRGTPMDNAQTYFTGEKTDVGVWPNVAKLSDGTRRIGVVQSTSFFTSKYFYEANDGSLAFLPVPPRSQITGLYEGRLLVQIKEDWALDDINAYQSGDLASVNLGQFLSSKDMKAPEIVFRPNARQAITGVSITANGVLMSLNDNVVGKVLRLVPSSMGWSAVPVSLPGDGQADIVFADAKESIALISYEGLLTPESLLQFDSASNSIFTLKTLPEKFDTADLEVVQNFVTSPDGTQVPYFLVHKKGLVKNGKTPTILYGYGGFEITIPPSYSAIRGKLWLEQGGAYAIANIRGGGEFGPRWHQAGLKTKRQVIFDDFIAVAEDLIDQRITSPDHLGIVGRSNGGLLMGVMITQRPDLWKAVDIGVPLLDMMRYHKLLAGASWTAEYGSPEIEEEAAFLLSISPYHNFDPEADYPVPFFYTSTKDDRVHPAHARKFAKLFEDAGKPFFYYENIDGGHAGAAKPEKMALRVALEYTYFANQLMPQE